MPEIVPDQNPLVIPTESAAQPEVEGRESNESFLGSVLVLILVILLIGVTTFFAFFGYRIWRESQVVRNTPSIQKIVEAPALPIPTTSPVTSEETKPEPSTTPVTPIEKASLDVKVMNGGAAKGSAGTFAETLKKAGYTKAAIGNTNGDYTGVTIYFATGKQKEAELVQTDVIKTYPKATILEAKAGNTDMTAATLVVILGK